MGLHRTAAELRPHEHRNIVDDFISALVGPSVEFSANAVIAFAVDPTIATAEAFCVDTSVTAEPHRRTGRGEVTMLDKNEAGVCRAAHK